MYVLVCPSTTHRPRSREDVDSQQVPIFFHPSSIPHPAPPQSMVWVRHYAEKIGTRRMGTFPRFLVLPFPGPGRMVEQTNATGPTSRLRSNARHRKMVARYEDPGPGQGRRETPSPTE